MKKNILNKSISELEGWNWSDDIPASDESFVIRRSYELHNKKLKDFTPSDLRFSNGQQEGLEYTVPLAMILLRENLFVETDMYEGALLTNVLKLPKEFWDKHPKIKIELEQLFIENQEQFGNLYTTDEIRGDIQKAFEKFKLG